MQQAAKVCLRGERPQCLVGTCLIWFGLLVVWVALHAIDIMVSNHLTTTQLIAMYLIKVNPVCHGWSIREVNLRRLVKITTHHECIEGIKGLTRIHCLV